jgi:dihydrofolate reductase
MTVHLIWAEARDRVIGAGGAIPWRLPGEQATFRERTTGSTVVMGRATWDSLPERVRPLPGRHNIVLTRDPAWAAPGATVAHSVAEARAAGGDLWVMGGESVYAAFLPVADHIVRTRIDLAVAGDTWAPELGAEWSVAGDSGWRTAETGVRFVIEDLVRAIHAPDFEEPDGTRYSPSPSLSS